jgi:antitoxin (DNA-binding transcriptional repressor) of toxin-antitoxin stability system
MVGLGGINAKSHLFAVRAKTSEGIIVSMATIHIPESEAARDFRGLLARARAGEEIVIEKEASPAVILRAAEPSVRRLSESLRLAREHASPVTLDGDFASDLEVAVGSHPESLDSRWD